MGRPVARVRVAILISGRGSNMRALIDAAAGPGFPAEICLVLSNVPDAEGLATAAAAGLPTATVDHRDYADRDTFEQVVDARLSEAGAEIVCLAGFLRLLTGGFVDRWTDRMINIHPSLLPAFKGLHTHERAIEAGVRISGCTVHFVRPDMDAGPIIIQAAVPVLPDDTPDRLGARILAEEHRIYPEALRLLAEGRIRVVGDRALIDGHAAPAGTLVNPEPSRAG